ncbi:GNAT family N-acetyltransferase [soil metagenome]
MTVTIAAFDPRTADDAVLAAAHHVYVTAEVECDPDGPLTPREELVADWRSRPDFRPSRWWLAVDDEQPVGLACLELNRYMLEHAELELDVLAEHRRRGAGTALLSVAADTAAAAAKRSLTAFAQEGSPGGSALRRWGFEHRYVERRSRLLTADLDRALLEGWVKQAEERAGDYELVGWTGSTPDELLAEFAEIQHVMNTAPLDDLDWPDEAFDPERARATDQWLADSGRPLWVLAARHRPSGVLAGYTAIVLHDHRPNYAEQGDTGVDPAHRNRGLGRWLKAVIALRLLDEAPEVAMVDTWNAESNDAMLGINVAMGFRPHTAWGGWQIDIADLTG